VGLEFVAGAEEPNCADTDEAIARIPTAAMIAAA